MTPAVHQKGSILYRLLAVLLLGTFGLSLVIFMLLREFSATVIEESQDEIIAASATAILENIRGREGQIDIDIPVSAFTMLGTISDERVFYAVLQDDQFITGYDDLPRPAPAQAAARFVTLPYRGEETRVGTVSRTVVIGATSHVITVIVAQTRTAQAALLRRMSLRAGMVGVMMAVLLGALGYGVSALAVEPINRLTASVARRGPTDLRPVGAPVPREMVPLVHALNGFMGRLTRSLQRSEDFITEAAHRIRTPLATVRSQAEVALRHVSKDENKQRLRHMIRAIDQSSRAAGQILDHAMVSLRTDHLAQQDLDLTHLVHDVVERLEPVAMLRDIQITVFTAGPVIVRADAILLHNALSNVLDNAIKYAPIETDVHLSVRETDQGARVDVVDHGAGFDSAEQSQMIDRFARGRGSEGVIGSGLGLTIVQEVMIAHGGRLSLDNKKGAGACVTLHFPPV